MTTARPVRLLWFAVFAGYLAFGATLQLLPGWIGQRFHAGALAAGTAIGIAFAATALCRPLAGRAGDAHRARTVVVAGGVLITVGAAGQWVAPAIWVLLLARLIMGAGEAALFSGALPWVLAGVPAARRGRVAGWFGLSMWSGLAVGPLITVAMTPIGGSRGAWTAIAALGITSTLLVSFTGRQGGSAKCALRPRNWREVLPRGCGLPGLVFGLAAYGYGTISALLVLYLRQSGLGGASVGLTVFAVAFLLTRAVGSPAVDRYGAGAGAVVMLLVEATGLVLLAGMHKVAAAMIGTALVGAGVSLMFPATVALTLERTGDGRAGTAVGATTSFWDVGILAAGPIGGLLSYLGYQRPFAVAALLATGAIVIVANMRTNDAGRPTRHAPSDRHDQDTDVQAR
jgi:MFS family permease